MAVRETSLMALEQVQKRLEPDQWAVFEILTEIGPAHDRRILEALNQREQKTLKPKRFKRRWEINQVTPRRNELVKMRLIRDIGTFSGYWRSDKKTYHFWAVQGDERELVGWERLPDKPHTIAPDRCTHCSYKRQAIKQKAEQPALARLAVSEAGSILARSRQRRKNQTKGQMALAFG